MERSETIILGILAHLLLALFIGLELYHRQLDAFLR
jgi:hypothetical protein